VSSVTGYKEAARALRQLGRLATKPVGEASKAALTPILKESKDNLKANDSYHRGILYRSMQIRRLKASAAQIVWAVTATGKGVGIAHLVEFGTEAHWQPKRNWMHPGARPFPFLTPAFHENDHLAIQIFGKAYGQALEAQAARLASRVR
jgi:HK97 gp10 family phage protein